ncbi:MAG: MoaD/ThiS family protein, partial [Bacteroidota bacterium]|nr:MoaD/ThiS family protein [Bacteroidota bacterium]
MVQTAYFYFYGNLNDFLSSFQKQKEIFYPFGGKPAVKDAIEALGVPHPEADVVLVNGQHQNFDYLLQANDRVAVYPAGTKDAGLSA